MMTNPCRPQALCESVHTTHRFHSQTALRLLNGLSKLCAQESRIARQQSSSGDRQRFSPVIPFQTDPKI